MEEDLVARCLRAMEERGKERERGREAGRETFWPRRNDRMGFLCADPSGSCYRFVFQTRG